MSRTAWSRTLTVRTNDQADRNDFMLISLLFAASLASLGNADGPTVAADVVFQGGVLIDGTGAARRQADVAVKGDRVVAVGTFKVSNANVKTVASANPTVATDFFPKFFASDGESKITIIVMPVPSMLTILLNTSATLTAVASP